MSVLWSIESEDGTIQKIIEAGDEGASISIGNKPLETSECVFKILNFELQKENEHPSDANLEALLKKSKYLSSSFTDSMNFQPSPSAITCQIGITSINCFDRMIEICLMKMMLNETSCFLLRRGNCSYNLQLSLESFQDVEELHAMDAEKLLSFSSQLKAEGVAFFTEKRTDDAFHKFNQALRYLILIDQKKNPEVSESAKTLMLTVKNNLAGCLISSDSKQWSRVIELCNDVLLSDGENVKALFRRGVAYMEIQEFDKAEEDFSKAKKLEPGNSAFNVKLAYLAKKKHEQNQKYASTMQKMFSTK